MSRSIFHGSDPSRRMHTTTVRTRPALMICALVAATTLAPSCSSSTSDDRATLTVIAYDSFVLPSDAFSEFTARTGIDVEVALGGDAGELVAKAALTAGTPEGDILWGVDNALLTRLIDADAFDPYVSQAAEVPSSLIDAALGVVTPVDFGFVCVNYDITALAARGVPPPETLTDLLEPEYRGMLVVPDATTSSPGLAFLLATVAALPDDWPQYWQRLVDNDVEIANGWTEAYYTWFTRHGGDRPLVVSYSTSPPAEVLLSDPPLPADSPAPTGIVQDTCFQQIEFAGILRGTDHPDDARTLVDFMISRQFQELLPENLFVYPANTEAEIPESFIRYTSPVTNPLTMTPDEIARRRVDLLDEWTRLTGS